MDSAGGGRSHPSSATGLIEIAHLGRFRVAQLELFSPCAIISLLQCAASTSAHPQPRFMLIHNAQLLLPQRRKVSRTNLFSSLWAPTSKNSWPSQVWYCLPWICCALLEIIVFRSVRTFTKLLTPVSQPLCYLQIRLIETHFVFCKSLVLLHQCLVLNTRFKFGFLGTPFENVYMRRALPPFCLHFSLPYPRARIREKYLTAQLLSPWLAALVAPPRTIIISWCFFMPPRHFMQSPLIGWSKQLMQSCTCMYF